MAFIHRYLSDHIQAWLKDRMVFIGGPRQIGKTFLAKQFLGSKGLCLSWDDLADRQLLKTHEIAPEAPILCLDEIHKYSRWRSLLKARFDKARDKQKIIVTGSARLRAIKRQSKIYL
jgi:predicted AAA+ superfamily ATPase